MKCMKGCSGIEKKGGQGGEERVKEEESREGRSEGPKREGFSTT